MCQKSFARLSARFYGGLGVLACSILLEPLRAAEADQCFVCGGNIAGPFYSITDQVTQEKRHVCKDCELSYPACFVCGLPARTATPGCQQLSDGRILCARDAKTAVLQADEGVRICRDVWDRLDRLFSRFIAFPEKNVKVRIVDRVHLMELFRLAGNDMECPNVWGFTRTRPGRLQPEHEVSVLGGVPPSWFETTCAHEYTHTWVNENLTESRRKNLSKDAEEGFCELVSYLFADSVNDEDSKARVLRNNYTRRQVDLFVAAESQFGFNDVIEWMKYGSDDRLDPDDPGRIRKIIAAPPSAPPLAIAVYRAEAPAPPRKLTLKAVFWDPTRPTALINDHTFGVNEEAKVRLGATNVTLRCLAIRKDAVRIQVADTGQELELLVKAR